MKARALAITALALALGTFMQVLDTTIANVSLPTIAGNLGATTDQGTWVITAFVVANGIGVPLTGWLMGRYGVVRIFVLSGAGLHRRVVSVRHRLEPGIADLLPHAAGRVVGPDDSRLPGAADFHLSRTSAPPRWASGPSPPWWRRSAARSWAAISPTIPSLGLDIPDQCAGGSAGGSCCAGPIWQRARRRRRKLPIDTVGLGLLIVWVGALQVMLDNGKDADWFASS